MSVKPATVWSWSLLGSTILWVLYPPLKTVWISILILHALILGMGISSLQYGFFVKARVRNKRLPQYIALTFDDGPDPALTPDILALLDRYNVPATFFLIAHEAEKQGELVRQICAAGHTIGCHDLDHHWSSNFRRSRRMYSDISKAQSILSRLVQKKVLLYRPPVGLTNPHTGKVLQTLGMHCIGWSLSGRDGGNRSERGIEKIPALARAGGHIVLLHDRLSCKKCKRKILNNIEQLLENIKTEELTVVPVHTLLNIKAYDESALESVENV